MLQQPARGLQRLWTARMPIRVGYRSGPHAMIHRRFPQIRHTALHPIPYSQPYPGTWQHTVYHEQALVAQSNAPLPALSWYAEPSPSAGWLPLTTACPKPSRTLSLTLETTPTPAICHTKPNHAQLQELAIYLRWQDVL